MSGGRRTAITLTVAALAAVAVLVGTAAGGSGGRPASATVTQPDLTALALGDGKTTTSGPARGYLYLCHTMSGGGGAATNEPWIHGPTYDLTAKYVVSGNVSWPARFKAKVSGKKLKLRGNGLPNHTTGTFPIPSTGLAYTVDRNPNSIKAYKLWANLPAHPRKTKRVTCTGGMVGVMKSGVPLFNAVDATGRDAVAHDVQDHCQGHPQESGVYHYHGLSSCLATAKPGRPSPQIGWALDGFPIYGPFGPGGNYLSDASLDVCHGTTSKVLYRGKKVRVYHYVANYEFPYTVGCFRGTPTSQMIGPAGGGGGPPPGA